MSAGFNTAKVSAYAKSHGISYEEACRRMASRPRRRRPQPATPMQTLKNSPARELWWLRD